MQRDEQTTNNRGTKNMLQKEESVSTILGLSPPAPDVSIEPKFGRPDMSSLAHSRGCAKATALLVSSFGADLVAEV